MIRHFESSGEITCAVGSVPSTGAITIAAVVEYDIGATLAGGIRLVHPRGGGYTMGMSNGGGQITLAPSGRTAIGSAEGFVAAGGKYLLAVTKATGNNKVGFHRYNFATKTWTHAESGTSSEDATGAVTAVAVPEGMQGNMSGAAMWNKVLSNAEIEALLTPTLDAWLATSPIAFWTFGQRSNSQNLKDWTGKGANQTSSAGSVEVKENVAPLIPYSEREELTWIPTLDSLKHATLEAQFTKNPWSAGSGTWSETEGWRPPGFSNAPEEAQDRAGIYLNNKTFSLGHAAAAVQIKENSVAVGRFLNIWLYLDKTKSKPTGYQLRLKGTGASTYTIELLEYKEGTIIQSKEVASQVVEATGGYAITKRNGKVKAFIRKTSSLEWTLVTELESTSFFEGVIGLGGNGSNPVLIEFAGAELEGTNEGAKEKKVKVLKNGSLVEAKRWVMRNGSLVNA